MLLGVVAARPARSGRWNRSPLSELIDIRTPGLVTLGYMEAEAFYFGCADMKVIHANAKQIGEEARPERDVLFLFLCGQSRLSLPPASRRCTLGTSVDDAAGRLAMYGASDE